MDVVVKGRNVEVPEHYRGHVTDKLDKAVRLDRKIVEIDVELLHERNPRQQDHCQRVEITCYSRGPVVRAEATAGNFYSALDEAISKLTGRLRRAADRRRMHRRRRSPAPTASLPPDLGGPPAPVADPATDLPDDPPTNLPTDLPDGHPGRIRREKEHPAEPITVDDALFRMELLGHDFYLFQDRESGRPSVVYRRKGYDYGVISLARSTGGAG